jgi:hypothetical protein
MAQARQDFDQLCLAVSLHAANAQDFTTSQREIDSVQRSLALRSGHVQIARNQDRFAWMCRRTIHVQGHLAANHQFGKLGGGRLRRVARANRLAAVDDRYTVRHGRDFSQFVRDEDDGAATRA